MCAVFSVVVPDAGINAEKIRVCAVDAFPHGNTDFGYGYVAGIDPDEPPPFATFKEDDPQEFITEPG